jgi:hypothetical protein
VNLATERVLIRQAQSELSRQQQLAPVADVLRTAAMIRESIANKQHVNKMRSDSVRRKKVERCEPVRMLVVRTEPREIAMHVKMALDGVRRSADAD